MRESYDEKSKSIVYLNCSYLKDINFHRARDDETPVDMFDIELKRKFFLFLVFKSIDVSKSI
jgi:hypothetical protein